MEKERILNQWHSLATAKTFDSGSNHDKTVELEDNHQLEVVSSATTTPISLLVQSLVQQLCTLLEKDVNRANQLYHSICEKLHSMKLIDDSYSMGEFEAMRSQYQKALYQLVAVSKGTEIPLTIPTSWPIVKPSDLEWSRYHREFEELYFIAGGGFGSVFKARHRLDGVEYAVKKIFIRSKDINSVMHHLAEVKTIASLNHANIVNYKAAWLEPMIEGHVKTKTTFQFDTDSLNTGKKYRKKSSYIPNFMESFKTHNSKELYNNDSFSDFSITFEDSDNKDKDSSNDDTDEIEFQVESQDKQNTYNKEICAFFSSNYSNCSRVNLDWATLYIQMTFCQQTLKQWLDERNQIHNSRVKPLLQRDDSGDSNSFPPSPVTNDGMFTYQLTQTHIDVLIDMFTQLVKGLHYIHTRGIIHHDIKPSNVFVATVGNNIQVQLGDFGLACPLQQSHGGMALGTQLYAAPEQLEGQCNPKSDMFSLGIIFLEMVETFNTDMERVKTITDLRKGQIPAQLTANYPKVAHIIGKLVHRRPSKRLDTTQLLQELRNLSENKDAVINQLREELLAKEEEIAKLKMLISKMQFAP